MPEGDGTPTPTPTPVPVKPNAFIIAACKFYHASLEGIGHIWKADETAAYEKAMKHAEALPDDLE